ncbi:MAG: hypothetical protein JWR69_3058 [Pedosphaera sp.]|nr:hypothetical protein [Pedosphaera sp.]
MKIVLQQAGTALYFKSLERWTSKPQEALDFLLCERAMHFVTEQHLSEVDVVAFPESGPTKLIANAATAARPCGQPEL